MVKSIDKFFLYLTITLIIVGGLFVFSSSWFESLRYTSMPWNFFFKHMIAIVLGLAIMVGTSFFHYKWWRHFAWIFVVVCLLLLFLTAMPQFGEVVGGSRRWLSLGFFKLQISEFVKIAAVILLAKAFYEQKHRIISMGLVCFMGFLVLKQPDLGTTMLILSSIVFVAFASGINLLIFLAAIAGLPWLVWNQILRTPYQMERIKYWLDPYSDPLGHGYNLIQSQNAIGSGGLWGLGFGLSKQKLGILPVPHADFAFSIICEEIGFLGAGAILLILLFWVLRAVTISYTVEDGFAQKLVFGLAGIFAAQVIINIGVATGLVPITGMTLPFISFGGSSFISSCVIAGIIMNVSRFANVNKLINV